MAAEAARIPDYRYGSFYGTAAPDIRPYEEPYAEPESGSVGEPAAEQQARPWERAIPREQALTRENARTATKTQAVSYFAVFGTVFAGVMMIFIILAQISYNEIASETVRLGNQMTELTEQGRKLEIAFESVIDMKEVERYARDTLGMSRPDTDGGDVIRGASADRAEILGGAADDAAEGFGSFISSLLDGAGG
ncbi:MAG: hypothetical protein FWH33_04790 [Oscillospiraceae bacterium]|nr:hypothetical protein [Oscillospiraceae bacterium]